MTLEGARSAPLQRLMALVVGVYLCSLVIALLFSPPATDYRRARGAGEQRGRQPEPEVIASLEEVGQDDLDLDLRFNHATQRALRRRRTKGTRLQMQSSGVVVGGVVVSGVVGVGVGGGGGEGQDNKTKEGVVRRVTAEYSRKLPKYNLVLNPEYLCHQVDDVDSTPGGLMPHTAQVYLLIIIHSHPGHKRRRNAIRETWGRVVRDYDRAHQVVLVFALGMPRDYDEYRSVRKEGALYHDIIVWDFTDDYRNLTLKSLAGFQWAAEHCANSTYIMKTDDDVYLNVPYLTEILTTYPTSSLILGSLNSDSPVRRYGQWKVDYGQFPAKHFPPYCSGCAYVISGDMTSRLHHLTQTDQPPVVLPVEDVYVTGLLAERLGVRCQHHSQFPTWITVPSVGLVQALLRGRLVGLHGVDWIRMHSLWHMIRNCPSCRSDVTLAKRWLSWVMDKDPMYR